MKQIDQVQEAIYTIEDYLYTEFKVTELARQVGYSEDHFSRMFKEYVGMPLSSYIKKRRLEVGIYRISLGESILEAAQFCGYDTHAGFYKAFKNQYGCSPSKYLKLNTVGPTQPINLIKESKKLMNKNVMLNILKNWNQSIKATDIDKLDLSHALRGNHTYKVNERFIFKSDVNVDHLLTHINIAKDLKEQGVNAPYPIPTINGEDYIAIDGVYYALLNYIDGEVLSNEDKYDKKPYDVGAKIGSALANLHSVLKDLENNVEVKQVNFKDQMLNWVIPTGKKLVEQWDISLPNRFFDELESNIIANYDELPKQLIHRDPNPTNYIFSKGEFNGFIDFEISEVNIRLFDVAYALTGLYIDTNQVEQGVDKWLKIKDGLLDGYATINPLTDREKSMLDTVMLSIQLIFIVYLYQMDDQHEMLKRNNEMLTELAMILSIN